MIKRLLTFNDKLIDRFDIVKRFAIHSFIIMMVLALLFIYFVYTFFADARHQSIHNVASNTLVQSESLIAPNLQAITNLDKPLTGKKLANFDNFIKKYLITKDIVRIKIWNKKGVIVYSDENRLIGKKFPIEKELKATFKGVFNAEMEAPNQKENKFEKGMGKELLEVYVPIYLKNKKVPAGAYEVYQKPGKIYQHLAAERNRAIILFSIILFILYLSLIWFFDGAYKRIQSQKKKLKRLNLELKRSVTNMEENYFDTIKVLTLAVDAKDHYTAGHSIRVADISVALAKKLDLSGSQIETIEKAALFHDIGKIGVAGEILSKPGRLTEEEYDEIKKHPVYGAKIISAVKFLKSTVEILKHHHEHFDGSGYPEGVNGTKINIGSRIIAVADAYDAITTTRPHRFARTPKEALMEIDKYSGTQFDPDVVKALIVGIETGDIDHTSLGAYTPKKDKQDKKRKTIRK